jgi:hypothetical protein
LDHTSGRYSEIYRGTSLINMLRQCPGDSPCQRPSLRLVSLVDDSGRICGRNVNMLAQNWRAMRIRPESDFLVRQKLMNDACGMLPGIVSVNYQFSSSQWDKLVAGWGANVVDEISGPECFPLWQWFKCLKPIGVPHNVNILLLRLIPSRSRAPGRSWAWSHCDSGSTVK